MGFVCQCGFQGLSQRAVSVHRTSTHGFPLSNEQVAELYLQGTSQATIASTYHVDPMAIHRRLQASGVSTRNSGEAAWLPRLLNAGWRIGTISQRPEPTVSKTTAYLLGALDGDGCIYSPRTRSGVRLQFGVTNPEFHMKIVRAMRELGMNPSTFIFQSRNPKWSMVYGAFAACKPFGDWYRTLQTQRHKWLPESLYWNYLCGFHEAEGSSLNNNGCPAIEIWNTNQDRLSDCKAMLEALGFHPTLRPARRSYRPNHSQGFKIGLYRGSEVLHFLTETATWKTGPWKEVMNSAIEAESAHL